MAGFFQDAWKISPRLTLTPGLRYEYFGSGHRTGHEKPLDASFYYGEGNSIYQRIANGRLLRTTEAPGDYQNHYFLPRHTNFAPASSRMAFQVAARRCSSRGDCSSNDYRVCV
jgi:outer membrane receptor protein involved in Fe transport